MLAEAAGFARTARLADAKVVLWCYGGEVNQKHLSVELW